METQEIEGTYSGQCPVCHEENINYTQPAEIDVDNQLLIWKGVCEVCGAEIKELYPYGYWNRGRYQKIKTYENYITQC